MRMHGGLNDMWKENKKQKEIFSQYIPIKSESALRKREEEKESLKIF